LEAVSVNFSAGSLVALNACLAFIMLGVALDMDISHFTQLRNNPRALLTGLFSQIVLLPFLTFLLVQVLPVSKGMALGMLLVAACPGGNVSNFFTMLARGNVALSVTLTAFSSMLAFLITPLNFFLWVSLSPALSAEVKTLEVNFWALTMNMVMVLLLPLIAGMWLARQYPNLTARIGRPIRTVSILMLASFIILALVNNLPAFSAYFGTVFWIVLLHNGLALAGAYVFSKLTGNSEAVSRTVAIETGIQNSGLGLTLIFSFFGGNTAMAIVAAWWGVWHLVSGVTFATWMRRKPVIA